MLSRKNIRINKTLMVSGLLAAFVGYISLLAPLDLVLTGASNKLRTSEASGNIVVGSLDAYAKEYGISEVLPADHAGFIADSLLAAGAEAVIFSVPVSGSYAQERHAQWLGEKDARDPVFFVEPLNNLRPSSLGEATDSAMGNAVHNEKHTRYWGGTEKVAYRISDRTRSIPSAECAASGVCHDDRKHFYVDYAIDVETIPAIEIGGMDPQGLARLVAGKNVVLGYEFHPLSAEVRILGKNDPYGTATLIALGGETILKGQQIDIGWGWNMLVAFLAAVLILKSKKIWLQSLIFMSALFGLFGLMTLLKSFGIYGSIANCLVLLVPVYLARGFQTIRHKDTGLERDLQTGLPTLNALRSCDTQARTLVTAKLTGFEELMNLLSIDQRSTLTDRIVSLLNSGDQIWYGNDGHFYWFLDVHEPADIEAHLDGLGVIFRNGFSVGNYPFSLPVIFGVDRRRDELISERVITANVALKQAIPFRKIWVDYQDTDQADAAWKMTSLAEFKRAMESGVLYAVLQPKVNIAEDRLLGAEALARWDHPERGAIRPDEFVGIAESAGLLKEMTLCILDSALEGARQGLDRIEGFKVALNISNSLITDESFCGAVLSVLERHTVRPDQIILEITECSAFEDFEACLAAMNGLVALGFTLSIDDYGTGNSTLEFVREIPAGELKIDRKFVAGICKSSEDRKLVQSTIDLAAELGMIVVAEGIETEESLFRLIKMGCQIGQGYLLSKPLSAKAFGQYLNGRLVFEELAEPANDDSYFPQMREQ